MRIQLGREAVSVVLGLRHAFVQGRQLGHMRGLCLFELFERTIAVLAQLAGLTPLHVKDGLKPLGSLFGYASSSLCRGKPFSSCSPYVAILPQLVRYGFRSVGPVLSRAEPLCHLDKLGLDGR